LQHLNQPPRIAVAPVVVACPFCEAVAEGDECNGTIRQGLPLRERFRGRGLAPGGGRFGGWLPLRGGFFVYCGRLFGRGYPFCGGAWLCRDAAGGEREYQEQAGSDEPPNQGWVFSREQRGFL
jgi:hypothetical protein